MQDAYQDVDVDVELGASLDQGLDALGCLLLPLLLVDLRKNTSKSRHFL